MHGRAVEFEVTVAGFLCGADHAAAIARALGERSRGISRRSGRSIGRVGPRDRYCRRGSRPSADGYGKMWPVAPAFRTKRLSPDPDAVAPDGSDVRVLVQGRGGGLAHFELAAGQTSVAVRHRSIEEIWYFLSGTGEMWRQSGDDEAVVTVSNGLCVTIPTGTAFQFRALGEEPLAALGVTIPPWPGLGEAEIVSGPWEPTVQPGPV